jgi:hypothetical protein
MQPENFPTITVRQEMMMSRSSCSQCTAYTRIHTGTHIHTQVQTHIRTHKTHRMTHTPHSHTHTHTHTHKGTLLHTVPNTGCLLSAPAPSATNIDTTPFCVRTHPPTHLSGHCNTRVLSSSRCSCRTDMLGLASWLLSCARKGQHECLSGCGHRRCNVAVQTC